MVSVSKYPKDTEDTAFHVSVSGSEIQNLCIGRNLEFHHMPFILLSVFVCVRIWYYYTLSLRYLALGQPRRPSGRLKSAERGVLSVARFLR